MTNGNILSTGSVDIVLNSNGRLRLAAGTVGGPTATGDIYFNTDEIEINPWGLDIFDVQSTSALTIKPNTSGTSIGLGGGAGTLKLDDGELARLEDGFSSITIGGDVVLLSEGFDDDTIPSSLELQGPAYTTSSGQAVFNGINYTDRTYLRTVASDFADDDFVAEVTVTKNDAFAQGGVIAFFGMGEGTPTGPNRDPSSIPNIYVRPHSDSPGSGNANVLDNAVFTSVFGNPGTGTHRLRMTCFTYAVDNVPPTISLSGDATVNEGSPYTLNLGVVTDPGADTITGY